MKIILIFVVAFIGAYFLGKYLDRCPKCKKWRESISGDLHDSLYCKNCGMTEILK